MVQSSQRCRLCSARSELIKAAGAEHVGNAIRINPNVRAGVSELYASCHLNERRSVVLRTALVGGRWLLIAAIAVLAACASSLRVANDFDHNISFANYHTFAWMPRERYETRNPLVVQRTRDAVRAELTQKGFTYSDDAGAADFVVDFTIGAHERVDIHSYPTPYAGPWYWESPGWWGYPYWGNTLDVRKYREGTLSIDVFDAHNHRAVWHGWAKKELTQADIDRSDAPIRSAVAAVLETFPPK
jgi:hypothetical protein